MSRALRLINVLAFGPALRIIDHLGESTADSSRHNARRICVFQPARSPFEFETPGSRRPYREGVIDRLTNYAHV